MRDRFFYYLEFKHVDSPRDVIRIERNFVFQDVARFEVRRNQLYLTPFLLSICVNDVPIQQRTKLEYGDILHIGGDVFVVKANFPYGIVTHSRKMKSQIKKLEQYAQFDEPVMIIGETGSGKELFARAIHELSTRKKGPFVEVNCAEFSGPLAPSLLFGHVKGAFTGATQNHKGFFEQADGGTLFLDEFGELDSNVQAMILRAIQTGYINPVGGNRPKSVNIRIVTATNCPINDQRYRLVHNFRDDLYFRLAVSSLNLPPLRERENDISLLLKYFVHQINEEYRLSNLLKISEDSLKRTKTYPWPGNVRELRSRCLEAIMTRDDDSNLKIDLPRSRKNNPQTVDKIKRVSEALPHASSLSELGESLNMSRTTLWRYRKRGGLNILPS